VRAENTGAAFSLGRGMGLLFIVAAFAAIFGILLYFPRFPRGDRLVQLAMGLLMGGAAGNLIDRLVFGHVTDFISVSYFAVINLADIWINLGVGFYILWVVRAEILAHRRPPEADSAA